MEMQLTSLPLGGTSCLKRFEGQEQPVMMTGLPGGTQTSENILIFPWSFETLSPVHLNMMRILGSCLVPGPVQCPSSARRPFPLKSCEQSPGFPFTGGQAGVKFPSFIQRALIQG